MSRLAADDTLNQERFNTSEELIRGNDIIYLPESVRYKIRIAVTCYNGGVDSVAEMRELAIWTLSHGIKSIIFNDLQKEVTDLEFWKKRI